MVDEDTVTAHVLITYNGGPATFAWTVPVPSVPELDISETMAFAILADATAPVVTVDVRDRCPDPNWECRYHPALSCGTSNAGDEQLDAASAVWDEADASEGGGGYASPVTVLQTRQVGSYDTIVFSAEDAGETVTWLQDNGFIVNESMTPYMQPYLDAGMLFLAAKLVPGAGVDAIRPLKMTYQHDGPIIPLRLTAVAAEPHLAVTSYIFAEQVYVPRDQPLAQVGVGHITSANGRTNYPMALTRAIDEAGGDAFVVEYAGGTPDLFPGGGECCDGDDDWCWVGDDGACQCPQAEFDASDCAEIDGLVEAAQLLSEISGRQGKLTRLTTRLSPEEMTFDPVFEPVDATTRVSSAAIPSGPLRLDGWVHTLDGCRTDVVDLAELEAIEASQGCATTYCGAGACVVTPEGAGCACDDGYVAREFTDLDGLPGITCVPSVGTVDFGLGLDTPLPDACAQVTVEGGECLDVGGFPASTCPAGSAGTFDAASGEPVCAPILHDTGAPGAANHSIAVKDVEVCAPLYPICGDDGWLVPNEHISIQGVTCEQNEPPAWKTLPGDPPTCGDGCSGAASSSSGSGWAALALLLSLLAAAVLRRRSCEGTPGGEKRHTR